MAFFAAVVLVGIIGGACSGHRVDVDFSKAEASPGAVPTEASRAGTLRIAVAPVLSAKPTSSLYQQLAAYLSAKLARPVDLVQGKTYAEINDMLKSGDVSVAIVCTNPYLQGKDDFGMELVAAPQVHGNSSTIRSSS